MMKWSDVCADSSLQDLPYKIELNAQGQIIMNPRKPIHSGLQGAIQRLLYQLKPEGYILPELALDTQDGTKTLDVAWVSPETYDRELTKDAFKQAPEICVEVVSPTNTMAEMEHKRDIYFLQGALEVWICQADGAIRFYDAQGELQTSKLCPHFPHRVSLRISPNTP